MATTSGESKAIKIAEEMKDCQQRLDECKATWAQEFARMKRLCSEFDALMRPNFMRDGKIESDILKAGSRIITERFKHNDDCHIARKDGLHHMRRTAKNSGYFFVPEAIVTRFENKLRATYRVKYIPPDTANLVVFTD